MRSVTTTSGPSRNPSKDSTVYGLSSLEAAPVSARAVPPTSNCAKEPTIADADCGSIWAARKRVQGFSGLSKHVTARSMATGSRLWLLRLVSTLIGMTAVLAVVELIFWVLPVREEGARILPDGDDRIARFDPNERWRYSAGWDFFIDNEIRTNNAGWVSDIDYVREADTPLVAFVGDSYVEGDHVPWPRHLPRTTGRSAGTENPGLFVQHERSSTQPVPCLRGACARYVSAGRLGDPDHRERLR